MVSGRLQLQTADVRRLGYVAFQLGLESPSLLSQESRCVTEALNFYSLDLTPWLIWVSTVHLWPIFLILVYQPGKTVDLLFLSADLVLLFDVSRGDSTHSVSVVTFASSITIFGLYHLPADNTITTVWWVTIDAQWMCVEGMLGWINDKQTQPLPSAKTPHLLSCVLLPLETII